MPLSMSLQYSIHLVILGLSLLPLIDAIPKVTPSGLYSNNTTTALKSSTTPVCCFVVQDTVTEEWFQQTSYSTTQNVVNLTSITTYITVFPNTTKSEFKTNVYTTNHTFNFTIPIGINPITLMTNHAPRPDQTTIMNENGTAVTTGGLTLTSPGAFYVYNTVKIITADPVTDVHGNAVCGTQSSFPSQGGFDKGDGPIPTFTNINSNAQAYFGGLGIVGSMEKPTETTTETITNTFTYTESTPPFTTTETTTFTETNEGLFYTDSNGDIVTQNEKPSGVVISLVTPFIYAPERGAQGETGEGRNCLQSGEAENFGFVPQSLIDFLASDERYKSLYPGIESCLPGGPSIIQITECQSVKPTAQNAGGDLTSGTVVYVTPEPANIPATKSSWSSSDTYPTTQEPATDLLPSTKTWGSSDTRTWSSSDTYPTTQQPATGLLPSTDTYPTTQEPATQLIPNPTGINDEPLSSDKPKDDAETANSPPDGQATSIGSIINSVLNGPPQTAPAPIIIPKPTTIPLSNAPAGLEGSTTTIDGVPFLVVPAATTVIPAPPSNLPINFGVAATISNTPVLIIPSPTTIPATFLPSNLDIGTTTTISGSAVVIIVPTTIPFPGSGTATLPVNPNISGIEPTNSAANPSQTEFLQASGAGKLRRMGIMWSLGGLMMFVCAFD